MILSAAGADSPESVAVGGHIAIGCQGEAKGAGVGAVKIPGQIWGAAGGFIRQEFPRNRGANFGIIPGPGLSGASAPAVDPGGEHPKPSRIGHRDLGAIGGNPGGCNLGNAVVAVVIGGVAQPGIFGQGEAVQHPADIGVGIVAVVWREAGGSAGNVPKNHAAPGLVVCAAHQTHIAAEGGKMGLVSRSGDSAAVGDGDIVNHRIPTNAPAHHAAEEAGVGQVAGDIVALQGDGAVILVDDCQILDNAAPAELHQAAELGSGAGAAENDLCTVFPHKDTGELLIRTGFPQAGPGGQGDFSHNLVVGVAQVFQHSRIFAGAFHPQSRPVLAGADVDGFTVQNILLFVTAGSCMVALLGEVLLVGHYRVAHLHPPAAAATAGQNGLGQGLQLPAVGDEVGVGVGAAANQQIRGDQIDIDFVIGGGIAPFRLGDIAGILLECSGCSGTVVSVNGCAHIAGFFVVFPEEPVLFAVVSATDQAALCVGNFLPQGVVVISFEIVHAPAVVPAVAEGFQEQAPGEERGWIVFLICLTQVHIAEGQLDIVGICVSGAANQAAGSLCALEIATRCDLHAAEIQSSEAAQAANQQGSNRIFGSPRVDLNAVQGYSVNGQSAEMILVRSLGAATDDCAIGAIIAADGSFQCQFGDAEGSVAADPGENTRVHPGVLPLGVRGFLVAGRSLDILQFLESKGDCSVFQIGSVIGGGVEGVAG